MKRQRQIVLITGGYGFIGSSFFDAIGNEINKYVFLRPTHKELDITNLASLNRYVKAHKPEVIINFAAHRNANTAEQQRGDRKGSVWKTNVIGVRNLVKISKQQNIYLIHISTDMVFSGTIFNKGPYSESSEPGFSSKQLSWYGWTKRLAEKAILSKDLFSSIVRIGNIVKPIYDPSLDFVGKILWLYDHKKLYPVFNDQFVTLSYVPDIVLVIKKLLKEKMKGIFHVASSDLLTPFDMAEYLLSKTRRKKGIVKKTSIDDFLKEFPNRYPKYGGLKSKQTRKLLEINFGSWREIVNDYIKYAK